jgi:O-antigen ligase
VSILLLAFGLVVYPLIAAIGLGVFLLASRQEQSWRHGLPTTTLLGGLMVGSLLQGVSLTLLYYLLTLVGFYLLIYLLTTRVTLSDFDFWVQGLSVGIILSSLYALYQVLIDRAPQASGFSFHANIFGSIMMLSSLTLMGALLIRPSSYRWLYLLAFLMGLMNIFLSGSRGAFVAFVFGLTLGGVLIALQGKVQRRFVLLPFILLSLGLLGGVTGNLVPNPLSQRIDTVDTALDDRGRLTLWYLGLELAAQSPLFGLGNGAWQREIQRLEPSIDLVVIPNSHNLYLELLIESGSLGLTAFLFWAMYLVVALTSRMVHSPLASVALVCLAAFLVHNLWDVLLFHSQLLAIAWLVISLGLIDISKAQGAAAL